MKICKLGNENDRNDNSIDNEWNQWAVAVKWYGKQL